MKNIFKILLGLALPLFFSGCTVQDNSLYHWGSYEGLTYHYLKGDYNENQLATLEKDLEHSRAKNKNPPPGFYAHMGLLYIEMGNTPKGLEFFNNEVTLYPESQKYLEFITNSHSKK